MSWRCFRAKLVREILSGCEVSKPLDHWGVTSGGVWTCNGGGVDGGVSLKVVEICTEGLLLKSWLFLVENLFGFVGEQDKVIHRSASLKTSLTPERCINGMSSPKAITRNESTGAGGIIRLSTTVEGSGMVALLNVSGTTWSFAERCSISKSNSAIEMHQWANFDCFGLMDVNHFKLALSVIILILRPKTYGRCWSSDHLTANTNNSWWAVGQRDFNR